MLGTSTLLVMKHVELDGKAAPEQKPGKKLSGAPAMELENTKYTASIMIPVVVSTFPVLPHNK